MKIIRIFFLVVLIGSCALKVNAQDPYYSQYFMSPMTVNPALIGKDVNDLRFLSNFRSQSWGTSGIAFKTTSISLESRIAEKQYPDDQFGVGISLINDASNGGLLNRNFVTIGGAFNKRFSKYSTFGVGITGTYANMLLDQSQFTFQSQFGSMGFIRSMPTYDPLLVTNKSYLNADGGIHYSYQDSVWGFNLGTAIMHAAQNKQGVFQNSNFTFLPRYSTRSSLSRKFKGGDELSLLASLDVQGINNIFIIGSIYKFNIPGEDHPIDKLNIGFFDRVGDSYYPYIGIESKYFLAGVSYDIINSDVKTYYNSVQSVEISVGFLFNNPKKGKRNTENNRAIIY